MERFSPDTNKTPLNKYGFPEDWSNEMSLQAMDAMRTFLKDNPTSSINDAWYQISKTVGEQAATYAGSNNMRLRPSIESGDLDPEQSLRRYFEMTIQEKYYFLTKHYPRGFPIKHSGIPHYCTWRFVLAFEFGFLNNHGQSLQTLLNRGSLSPREILAAVEYMPAGKITETDDEVLNYLKTQGFLTQT